MTSEIRPRLTRLKSSDSAGGVVSLAGGWVAPAGHLQPPWGATYARDYDKALWLGQSESRVA